jgi:hypothetical protein
LRRLAVVSVVAVVMVSLLLSVIPLSAMQLVGPDPGRASHSLNALEFSPGLNTSSKVKEYPLIARSLMLPGGSTSATLADLNGDNRTDLIVSVYETKNVSIFYRERYGNFSSYPSYNISLLGHPIAVAAFDVLGTVAPEVIVLERKASALDRDHIEIFNYVSKTSFARVFDIQPSLANATGLAVGEFNGDTHLDVAVSSAGSSPLVSDGRIDISYGPTFSSWDVILNGGRGTYSLVAGDFNSDGKIDLACANQYNSTVLVYYQPFSNLMSPSLILSMAGQPVDLVAGNLSANDHTDLAIVTVGPDLVHFYFQSLGNSSYHLPAVENLNRSLPASPSKVISGDMNNDSLEDILVLSRTASSAYSFYQHPANPVWSTAPDFDFPTQAGPQGAVIGRLDFDSQTDIAVMGARNDWSGSSIGVYPGHPSLTVPYYSFTNSNLTVPTDQYATASMFASGDINGDGKADMIVLYPNLNSFGYMLSFVPPLNYWGLGFIPGKIIVSDLNDDSYADILVTALASPDVRIYFGTDTPDSGFESESIACGGNVSDVALGDLNNDTMVDLAVSTANGMIDVFFNTWIWDQPFSSRSEISPTPGTEVASISVHDFNSDGLDDLAYSDGAVGTCTVRIYLQNGTNSSLSRSPDVLLSTSASGHFGRIWSGDLNGDEKTDIAAMAPNSKILYLFKQQDFMGSSPGPYDSIALPEVPVFISVTDATDDGHADILTSLPSADLTFLYKQDSGVLPDSPSMTFVTGALPNYALIGDANGDFLPDLMVSDSGSHCLSVWHMVNFPPVAHAGGPYIGVEGTPLELLGSAGTGISELPHMQYRWSFGDGNTSNWSSDPVGVHEYIDEGTYNVTFEAKDPANLTDSDNTTATIIDSVPKVDFTWSPVAPKEGQLVTFTDNTSFFDPDIMLNWTIDGQLVSSGMNHTIFKRFDDGIHTVMLQVTDNDGSTNQTEKNISVSTLAPTVTIAGPSTGYEGTSLDFAASVDPWHSGLGENIVSYEWDFSYTPGAFVTEAYTSHATHTFSTQNLSTIYTVACRATDDDGNQSLGFLNITILDVTTVTVQVTTSGQLHEFQMVNFSVSVDSASSATGYEWDFMVQGGVFTVDNVTSTPQISHRYTEAGYYLVWVRASLSNGSKKIGPANVDILNVVPTGDASDILVTRNPTETGNSNISFDASSLAGKFPDIVRTQWSFGDGYSMDLPGGPIGGQSHVYSPTRDYVLWLNLTDDDGSHLTISTTLKLFAPTIELRSPSDDTVIRSGTPLRFAISDDSPPLLSVKYQVDGAAQNNFTIQWEIPTTGWSEGTHTLLVNALDRDGNIAVNTTVIIIDDISPQITVTITKSDAFGGSKLNITVTIDDVNINDNGVILNVKLPGYATYQSLTMIHASGDLYYRVIEVPMRDGDLMFNVTATDLAGNSAASAVHTIHVKVHFIDAAWPYILVATILAALGVSAYFMREVDIAVDEAFVVYNDGRLISHTTRRLKPGMDDQILGGMFVAIQDFVKDSFKDVTSFTLRKLEFGEKSVLIEKGDHVFLAVILHRKASRKVASKMEKVVDEIETKFGEHLDGWDGDLDKVRGVGDLVKKLYSRAPLLNWRAK